MLYLKGPVSEEGILCLPILTPVYVIHRENDLYLQQLVHQKCNQWIREERFRKERKNRDVKNCINNLRYWFWYNIKTLISKLSWDLLRCKHNQYFLSVSQQKWKVSIYRWGCWSPKKLSQLLQISHLVFTNPGLEFQFPNTENSDR